MLPTVNYPVTVCNPLLYAVLLLLTGCGFRSERPVHRDKMEVGTDAKGRVVYKKFEQLTDDVDGRSIATITQKFDTAGRLISEFGTDHPRFGKQYFYDIYYDSNRRLTNYFRWPKIDTSARDSIPLPAFVEQLIETDSADFTKIVQVTKISTNKKNFIGRYLETFPPQKDKAHAFAKPPPNFILNEKYRALFPLEREAVDTGIRIQTYTFKMPLRDFVFDDKKRLVLKNVTVIKKSP